MTADDDLCTRPATELAALVRDREVSARELLEAHLARIERLNPQVNAVVTLDAEGARAAADAADAAQAAGEPLRPLHGLPVAHKDTHATGGMRTTWGSPLHADTVPLRDELVVARMAAAGAIRVGKTNVPEFAAGSHTFNTLFGATHNPYRHGLSAGGSSGGGAAALAAGFVPLADGSDMGGSLRNPAAFCNVVGLRPTPGRVPTWPAPMAWSQLSVQGPMGRTVADVALQMSVLAGPDRRVPIALDDDPAGLAAPLPERLDGLRVAWAPDLGGRVTVDPAIVSVLAASVRVFEDLGATVEDDCPDLSGADEVFGTLRAWLFDTNFSELARRHPDQVKESIRWNAGLGAQLSGADLARAEQLHTKLHERMVAFFERYDVLLAPTTQVLPFPVEIEYPTEIAGVHQENYLEWMRSCTVISATGCPALSVPGGFTPDGLPVGLQVVGPPRADRRVLEVGHAFEQATGFGRRRPAL
ncbi:amidase [Blastococcus saxobsidens]|uniref:Amidase, Asp-tRNAAsn/Glu-tRNAGln amidotransferase A subunit n=1 Tax=Blastococcus saxobsidens (strain DD2) TaxID=1146883 RepID=H6RV06_BLASD|nr:amidase [Blastococcus saxobsidens]CCG05725.1 Amidase, Asp-tRNAAsn/Glu-tRNAGln amidotransferase A subunit [Blastococcus saxobsidens DD2]